MKKINISTNKHPDTYTLVDDEAYEWLSAIKWSAVETKSGLKAKGVWKRENTYIHRLIMKSPKGLVVDHINHNTLDNRKDNLRACTQSQNCMNKVSNRGKSKYKGVTYSNDRKRIRRWRAIINQNGKNISLGRYKTPEEAALAYNTKAKEIFGEFAYLNEV